MSVRAQCLVLNDLYLLLVHYVYKKHSYWGLPGSYLKAGETPETAARRALTDACKLKASKLRLLSQVNYAADDSHYTFEVRGFMGELKLGQVPRRFVGTQTVEAVTWRHVDKLSALEFAFALSSGLLVSRAVRRHLRCKQATSQAISQDTNSYKLAQSSEYEG